MGKGDRRTKKGKIWRGTTGKRRSKQGKTVEIIVAPPKAPQKKTKRATRGG